MYYARRTTNGIWIKQMQLSLSNILYSHETQIKQYSNKCKSTGKYSPHGVLYALDACVHAVHF